MAAIDWQRLSPRAVRKVLARMLPTDAYLTAFCIDYFSDVADKFTDGMNRLGKENLLFQLVVHQKVLVALKEVDEEKFKEIVTKLNEENHAEKVNPYRGLSPFGEKDQDVFCGRDKLIERLWQSFRRMYDQVETPRLLTILGPSGSGKSSVVRAGLVPRLKQQPVPGANEICVAVFRPGEQPLEALNRALQQIEDTDQLKSSSAEPPRAEPETAQTISLKNHSEFRIILEKLDQSTNRTAVIVIDQFEEIYTICSDPVARDIFVDSILELARHPGRKISFIATLRSDFLGDAMRNSPVLSRIIASQHEIAAAMTGDELQIAIARPAELAGRPLDKSLVSLLAHEVAGNTNSLPVLQYALTQIWDGLSEGTPAIDTLNGMGGVGGALAKRAEETYQQLTPANRQLAQRCLLRLVQVAEGTRDVRRRVELEELVAADETKEEILPVLRCFAADRARLIMLSGDADSEQVAEIAHEALFEHWAELRRWLDEHRQDRLFHQQVAQAAKRWAQQGRPRGSLWFPPNLSRLRDLQARSAQTQALRLSSVENEFWRASERQYQLLRRGAFALLATLAVAALVTIFAISKQLQAEKKNALQEKQFKLSNIVERARRMMAEGDLERGAVLLAHAYKEGAQDTSFKFLLPRALRPLTARKAVHDISGKLLAESLSAGHGLLILSVKKKFNEQLTIVWDLETKKERCLLDHKKGHVQSAALSPDAQFAATGDEYGNIIFWDLTGERCNMIGSGSHLRTEEHIAAAIRRHSHGKAASAVASPATLPAVASAGAEAAKPGAALAAFTSTASRITQLAFDRTGQTVASADNKGAIKLWSRGGGVRELKKPDGTAVRELLFARVGNLLVSSTDRQVVSAWNPLTKKSVNRIKASTKINNIAISSNGVFTAVAGNGFDIHVYKQNKEVASLLTSGAHSSSLSFSEDGRFIAATGPDHLVRIWDFLACSQQYENGNEGEDGDDSCKESVLLSDREEEITKIFFLAGKDNHYLAGYGGYGEQGRIIIWNIEELAPSAFLTEKPTDRKMGAITYAGFGTNEHAGLTAQNTGNLCVWNQKNEHWESKCPRQLGLEAKSKLKIRAVAMKNQDEILSVDSESIHFFYADGKEHGKLPLARWFPDDPKSNFEFNHTNNAISVMSRDWFTVFRAIDQIKIDHKTLMYTLRDCCKYDAGFTSIQISDDEKYVAVATDAGRLCMWRLDDYKREPWYCDDRAHDGAIRWVAFSRDGRRLATAGDDRTVVIWSLDFEDRLGNHINRLRTIEAGIEGHRRPVQRVEFSPDGTRLVTVSDKIAYVWALSENADPKRIAVLEGHPDDIVSASFSPDSAGQRLMTASKDGTVYLWPVGGFDEKIWTQEQLAKTVFCSIPLIYMPESGAFQRQQSLKEDRENRGCLAQSWLPITSPVPANGDALVARCWGEQQSCDLSPQRLAGHSPNLMREQLAQQCLASDSSNNPQPELYAIPWVLSTAPELPLQTPPTDASSPLRPHHQRPATNRHTRIAKAKRSHQG